MNILYIMQGLPGSGKTTKAKEIMEDEGRRKRMVRVNRDLLREMLHFGEYSSEQEKLVRFLEEEAVEFLFREGVDVIVDDTNLKLDDLLKWRAFANKWGNNPQIWFMDTPLEECIERDAERLDKHVGEERIREMSKTLESCREELNNFAW